MWKSASVLVALLCVMTSCLRSQKSGETMDVFRLPGTTWPESYDLFLVPHLDGPVPGWFSGVVKIAIVANASAETIAVNLKDLNVTAVSVEDIAAAAGDDGTAVVVAGWDCVPRNEQLLIRLRSAVVPGRRYLMTVRYEGPFRDDNTGWYLSSYNVGDVTKWLAITQFEATNARRAFPCYDEPAYKAVFTVSITKQKNQTALSNMPIRHVEIESTSQNYTETIYFESTPPMPTYLLAFYVGDFVPNKNGSKITIYTHKDVVDQTEYAWNEAPKHVRAMEDYTGISFELPKLDLVALPECYFGAMENWGMNTYKEVYLLLHNESKTLFKFQSSTIMQHEFVHNWFGNLVTCAWWDYIWLNEGFARYFQYFATGMVRTTWPVEEWFIIESHQYSMTFDQTPKHPITASVNTPDEISAIFDAISYNKAASVLRMLRYLVTEELFKLSLQKYLEINKYKATIPDDLFSSFDNVLLSKNYTIGNELSVHQFMSNWTLQSGYPVLHITKNEKTRTFSVTQSRFFINSTDKDVNISQAWHIGLTYTTEFSKNFNYSQPFDWTSKTSSLTVVSAPYESGWYIFNIQSTGFYRVNYDLDNWMALINQLKNDHNTIHVLNRMQLINDAFALARAGLLDYIITLQLSKYLKNEDSVSPFYSAMNGFSYLLDRMPRNQEAYGKFKAHVGRLVGYIYKKIEKLLSNSTTDLNIMCAWNSFSVWAVQLDNTECTTMALEYFKKWELGEKIPADIKDAAFCMGVKNSNGDKIFNQMFQLFVTTTSISEKKSAALALGCSANRTQLTGYINHILDGSKGPVKVKDYTSIINAISVTPMGLDVLYKFLSTNLDLILEEVHKGENIVTTIYSTLASKVTKDDEIEKIKYLKDNTSLTPFVKSSFDCSFEQVESNLAWFKAYSDVIGQWVIKNEEKERAEQENTPSTPITRGSTFSAIAATTVVPEPSGASTKSHPSLIFLLLIVYSVLVKINILYNVPNYIFVSVY